MITYISVLSVGLINTMLNHSLVLSVGNFKEMD